MTATTTGHYQRCDHSGQADRCGHRQPARGGRPEIPLGTLTNLVQPSHLTPRSATQSSRVVRYLRDIRGMIFRRSIKLGVSTAGHGRRASKPDSDLENRQRVGTLHSSVCQVASRKSASNTIGRRHPIGQFTRLRLVRASQRRGKGTGMTDGTNPLAKAMITTEVIEVTTTGTGPAVTPAARR
jgi:hypothetical protein